MNTPSQPLATLRGTFDAAVYRLYDLSAEEVKIVEGGNWK